jgi:hypothetical protein
MFLVLSHLPSPVWTALSLIGNPINTLIDLLHMSTRDEEQIPRLLAPFRTSEFFGVPGIGNGHTILPDRSLDDIRMMLLDTL